MELLTARQYAIQTGVPERNLTRWAKAGEVGGAYKVGNAWAATRAAWDAAAGVERKVGRPRLAK